MIKYDKLIRDKIVEKIESKGRTAKYHIATPEEFECKLKDKLVEETKELVEAHNLEEIRNELADVFKVTEEIMKLHTISEANMTKELIEVFNFTAEIMKLYHISKEEISEIIKRKDDKAGGFDKRIILEEASEF